MEVEFIILDFLSKMD